MKRVKDLWREKVASGETELGYQEWLDTTSPPRETTDAEIDAGKLDNSYSERFWEQEELEADQDHDYCRDCDKVTRWDGEVCTVCGRVWGSE